MELFISKNCLGKKKMKEEAEEKKVRRSVFANLENWEGIFVYFRANGDFDVDGG